MYGENGKASDCDDSTFLELGYYFLLLLFSNGGNGEAKECNGRTFIELRYFFIYFARYMAGTGKQVIETGARFGQRAEYMEIRKRYFYICVLTLLYILFFISRSLLL
jgi:hypothetical protein